MASGGAALWVITPLVHRQPDVTEEHSAYIFRLKPSLHSDVRITYSSILKRRRCSPATSGFLGITMNYNPKAAVFIDAEENLKPNKNGECYT
jgi:hypothetical protein